MDNHCELKECGVCYDIGGTAYGEYVRNYKSTIIFRLDNLFVSLL